MADCEDGSDELNCKSVICADKEFQCDEPDYRCIPSSWVCDGEKDCSKGSDEKNCTDSTIVELTTVEAISVNLCNDREFRCSSGSCIPKIWVCDGDRDCLDGKDELECENKTTLPQNFSVV
ncbi:hypothetical protein ILUMI_18700 [Ignelater luminosus]|uniref:Uncharacterized protein n=1 Tax=Ignelater luminosus TaxID=2038154 RepID=A0A8K0G6L6_IGNLU|nr:hypothetical protein ILUMI_18700 [Ignelater luminosus]